MICTAEYYAGVENFVAVDKRRGVFREGALIHWIPVDPGMTGISKRPV